MKTLLTPLALVLCAGAAHADDALLRCDITSKFICTSSGCQPAKLAVFNLIDMRDKTLARCDSKGCDPYTATFSSSGLFLNIAVPTNGLLAKLGGNGDFVEVATLAGQVYSSFGSCKRVPRGA
ncbi:hypothetical protein [Phyllobacterium lublinensis]|uniref:hypothetical protein n=1 Tax=Phyllobacterium lublinensis TaxID=2875708 RepID=UPI001CCFB29B|nr:hypothetical protein [Phyllobacterium sp. 2063]MBZ9654022.1 hypothetical protein [Phyllobacterium sp. 2063]